MVPGQEPELDGSPGSQSRAQPVRAVYKGQWALQNTHHAFHPQAGRKAYMVAIKSPVQQTLILGEAGPIP